MQIDSTVKEVITILLLTQLSITSCNSYKEVKTEELKSAFVLNSSPSFEGYYYNGSDNDFHYFKSKWSFQKDKEFKIPIGKLLIENNCKFKLGSKELRIDLFKEGNELFGQTEFCKLYVIRTID